ncbi:hypothetical protein [Paenibacillus hamazuiensis]|uniref:hypothetical protein n=1 Tax=Paenibacillus hamazuiensis TaxID=2936508 RepID=UPI00200E9828|nr:hypothetical protein [Paenibacillus hamazuiensis]
MNERQLPKESTIYNYRLLTRVRYSTVYRYSYLGLLAACFAYDLYQKDPLRLPICIFLTALVHHWFIRLLFKMKEERTPLKSWSYHAALPWIGLVPDQYYSLSKFKKNNLQLFWVPLLIIACTYPWVSTSTLLHLIGVHIWLLAPRFLILLRFKKHTKIGLIKINPQDTSCYTQ